MRFYNTLIYKEIFLEIQKNLCYYLIIKARIKSGDLMLIFKKTALTIAILAVSLTSANAASIQGKLGQSSTGTAYISISKSPQAEVTSLTDKLVSNNTLTNLTGNVCIFSNTGNFSVTAIGDGPDNKFQLKGDSGILNYEVSWKNHNSASKQLQANQASTFAAASCNGASDAAKLHINLSQADIGSDKSYAGTLTLMVSPY